MPTMYFSFLSSTSVACSSIESCHDNDDACFRTKVGDEEEENYFPCLLFLFHCS